MRSNASSPPPPYDESDAARKHDLQASFAQLTRQHVEIRILFMKVATELEASPKIGGEHMLAKEWDALSKKHKKLYRDSQHNASACASFLKHYAGVLIPLSNGRATTEEQKAIITNFMEGIPGHKESARQISENFDELAREVELFPTKVERTLKEAESGWLQTLKSGVEWVYNAIEKGLRMLLTSIINAFRSVLSCAKEMRFSCGPFVRHMDVSIVIAPPPSGSSSKGELHDVKAAAEEIAEKLTGFEDAWHLTSIACNDLLRNVERADYLSSMPGSFHAYLEPAEIQGVYYPMVHCMEAYARGKSLV
ncbi:uncharacterized protein PHACADRAFT_258781, partial [Phanerochaete carnosa HHB-10118-sp]